MRLRAMVQRTASRMGTPRSGISGWHPAFLDTLSVPAFRYLWLSNGLTIMGENISRMAIAWLVLELTDSKLMMGITNSLLALPIILLSLFGGVISDRFDRRTILIRSRFALMGLSFLTAFLITTQVVELWHILLLVVLAGGVSAFDWPTAQTIVFDAVGRERLLNAVSLNSIAHNLASIVGPSIAGVLIAISGVDTVLYCLGGAYLVALVALLFVRLKTPARQNQRASALRDLAEGLSYVRRTPHVAWLLFLGCLIIFAGVLQMMLPVYARDVLDEGAKGLGFLMGAYGAGGLIASASLAIVGNVKRQGGVVVLASVIYGVVMLAFAFSTNFQLSLMCSFLMGFGAMYWVNNMHTLIQTSVLEEMRGRVMSIFRITRQSLTLGWLLGGVLSTLLGNVVTLVLCASMFIGLNLLAYLRSSQLRET